MDGKHYKHKAVNAKVKIHTDIDEDSFTDEDPFGDSTCLLHLFLTSSMNQLTLDFSLFNLGTFMVHASLLMYIHAGVYDFIPTFKKKKCSNK